MTILKENLRNTVFNKINIPDCNIRYESPKKLSLIGNREKLIKFKKMREMIYQLFQIKDLISIEITPTHTDVYQLEKKCDYTISINIPESVYKCAEKIDEPIVCIHHIIQKNISDIESFIKLLNERVPVED